MARVQQIRSGVQGLRRFLALPIAAAVSHLANVPSPHSLFAYTVGIIAVGLATLIRWWLGQLVGQNLSPYVTFYPFIMLAALYGGTGTGLLATLLASLIAPYLFLPPTGSFLITHPADQVSFVLFIAINVAVSLICGALRFARNSTFAEARRARAFEERFRLFMDHTPTLAWIKDDQGRYTYINKAYEQRFGRTLAECQGKTDADLWPPDVAARLQKADHDALVAGQPIEVTEETTEGDGSVSFWLNTKFPVRDAAGRQFIASIGLDITDRKRFQEALQEREARLRLAVETAELGTYERDLLTNQITINPACQAILGATQPFPRDLARRSLHPEDRDLVLAQVACAFDPNTRAVCSAEFRLLRPDGTLRWVFGRGRVLFDDRAHPPKPVRFIGVLNDITARKHAEEALRLSEEHYRRVGEELQVIMDATPVALFVAHDPQCQLITGNHRAHELFGVSLEERNLSATPSAQEEEFFRIYRGGQELAGADLPMQVAAATGIVVRDQELEILRRDGSRRTMLVTAAPLFAANGKPRGAVGTATDITDRKKAEEALRQARDDLAHANTHLDHLVQARTAKLKETVAELEHFSYTITHDMRAPLRAITGYAGILASLYAKSPNDESHDLLRRISESALRMDQLITDALQYSRVVQDKFPLQPIDPADAIRGLVESYPHLQPPHAHITVQSQMPRVLANQAGFTQVFSNLLGNAAKFVAPGQVPQITVTAETPSNPSALNTQPSMTEWVRISVTDNGIGIPPEYQDRIWQMFQRLSTNYEGTGIGLALVRKVVERMQGRIGVESNPGQGSRFWVELQKAP